MTRIARIKLFGPTSVGKGFMVKLLRKTFGQREGVSVGTVSIGDEIRTRMKSDPKFKATFGPIVARGDCIPDEPVCRIYDDLIEKGTPHNFLVFDGFHRSPAQVAHAEKRGHLDDGSAFIVLLGSRQTCLERLIHRTQLKPDGDRIDEDKFDHRYNLNRQTAPKIIAAVRKTNTRIIFIDANRDLETEVFPDVLAVAECVASGKLTNHRLMQSTN